MFMEGSGVEPIPRVLRYQSSCERSVDQHDLWDYHICREFRPGVVPGRSASGSAVLAGSPKGRVWDMERSGIADWAMQIYQGVPKSPGPVVLMVLIENHVSSELNSRAVDQIAGDFKTFFY